MQRSPTPANSGSLISARRSIVIRATNIYGDPFPWSQQQSPLFTVFSFIKCEKYPPSLLYLLMTLGPCFIALALLDRDLGKFWRPFIVFGRVPLFFYIIHIFLIHAIALLISYVRHGGPSGLFVGPLFHDEARSYPPDYGSASPESTPCGCSS